MKRLVFPAVIAALTLFVMAHALSCREGPAREPSASTPTPVDIRVVTPSSLGGPGGLSLSGRVKAAEEITVTAQMAGRLTAMPLREGAAFRSGQILASFDAPETRQALESAEAGLASASAGRTRAQRQAIRVDSLFQRGMVAESQLESAVADREAAEAAWRGAQAFLTRLKSDTRLSMPFDGVVVRRHVDTGVLLVPGQAILDVRSAQVSGIEVAIPESEIPRLATGNIQVRSGSSAWVPATVVRVDGMTDHRTRTRTAHLRPAEIAGFEPGAYAEVRFDDLAGEGRLAIPVSSLVRRGSLTGFYVVEEGRAWLRWFRAGRTERDQVEVLSGLAATDAVVADPRHLVDGAFVRLAP
jgi:RND family efflux transporter MFP subunit